MILPTKHIPPGNALLTVGETVLRALENPTTPSSLWEVMRSRPEVGTWSRFILTLDLLHIMGVLEFRDGLLTRMEMQ
jgi:hypothetical protein